MNTNETNEWRPLESGELADVNDTECLTPDGAWVKAQGCHMYTLEEVFAEYGPTQLRTRRPRPAPTPECKCDMRTKLVGDGCSVCNPERYAEYCEPDPDEKTGGGDQQTAREWVDQRRYLFGAQTLPLAQELAARADRAEAEVQRLKGLFAVDNVLQLLQERDRAEAERDRLNKMRTHCPVCGADYLATGVEAGCTCKLRAERDALLVENGALRATIEARTADVQKLREALDWLEDEAPVISHDAWSCSVDMAGNMWTNYIRNNGKRERIRGRTLIDTIDKARAALAKEGQR